MKVNERKLHAQKAEIHRLQWEIVRLREALDRIERLPVDWTQGTDENCERLKDIAREASSGAGTVRLDGCILLTREEAAKVRAQMALVGADYADTAYGREVLAARALLTPEPTKEDA